MSSPMVRALLAGTKTQTRRVITPQPPSAEAVRAKAGDSYCWIPDAPGAFRVAGPVWAARELGAPDLLRCRYGAPGDRLWVRESWRTEERDADAVDGIHFRADDSFVPIANTRAAADRWMQAHRRDGAWRPSIHMPRWASRMTLEVTGVRVERLQQINEDDARAEGVEAAPFCKAGRPNGMEHVEAYEDLWDAINGKRWPWSSNPWVWVVSFRRIDASASEVRHG